MEIHRKDLKRRAREAMSLASPKFWLVCLVYLLLTSGVDGLFQLVPSAVAGADSFSFFGFFTDVLYTLYSLVVQFGFTLWALWTWRRQNPGLGSLIQGFSIPGRILVMELLIFLRVLGWTVLISYALTLLVMAMPSALLNSGTGVFVYLGMIGLIYGAVFILMLRYAMAPYLLADRPDDGPSPAIRRSVEMMRGRKWELFKLEFSFIGWNLLQFLLLSAALLLSLIQAGLFSLPFYFAFPLNTTTIPLYEAAISSTPTLLLSSLVTLPLSLWLTPYISVSRAGFYDSLCRLGRADEYEPMPPL